MSLNELGKKACSVTVSALMAFQITGFGSLAYASEPESGVLSEMQDEIAVEGSGGQGQDDAVVSDTTTRTAADDSSSVVPGADAPVSPTNVSTHLDISAEDLLSEEELSAAYSKRMARSAWDYSSATFADVLVYAEQYIGLPYVWGGKDLYRDGGFDCSGFVNWVYNNVCGTGINSDWTNASSLYYDYCTPVSEADARPGDIVFWKGTYQSLGYISHVGIYCGNGICIDAGDPIGYDRVTDITNMNGVSAERVYGRLVSLSSTSVDLNSAITKVRVADQAYTGGARTPSPTVVSAGSVLSEGSDYWVSYESNVNVGTASVVIHGIGRFDGQEVRKNFEIYQDLFESGAWVVSSALNASQVLDVPAASMDAGVSMQLYARNDSDAQTFEFEKTGDGYYAIRNIKSGLYLSLYTTWAELRNETTVTQQWWYGGLSQKWCIKPVGNGQYVISSAMDCSMVLDVSGGVASNGSAVQAYADNGTAAQRWAFSPAKTLRERVDELAAANAGTLAPGTYSVGSALGSSHVIDAAGAGTADGTAAQVWSANGTDAQAWLVEDAGGGYVTVRNAASGLALDVPGADACSGAQLQLWTPNGSWAQKWVAVRDGSGVRLVSALSDSLSVDLTGASTADGTRLQLWADNGTAAQRWAFEECSKYLTISYDFTLQSISLLNGGSGYGDDAVTAALDPASAPYGSDYFYQFADCRGFTGQVSGSQIDRIIDNSGTGRNGVFAGKGQAIVDAARAANINEMYLMAHIMTETAWGTSSQAWGKYFDAGDATIKLGSQYYTKWCSEGQYYNFIGWGAYDSNPDTAYDFSRYYGWNSIESALMGAAEKVANNYIFNGQETVYEMRWNPDAASIGRTHQYCSDINWARTIASIMGYSYRLIGVTPSISYRVPSYL